tara:strand:+ start:142 stop:378 length:237 start_codon:yes stop_codon:yes gene_type:complete
MASPKKKRLRYLLEMESNVLLETEEQEIEIERLAEQNDALESIVIREEAKLASARVKTRINNNNQNNRKNKTSRKKNR